MTPVGSPDRAVADLSGTWPIVGREEQLARVVELLSGQASHAVVLGGPSGVGKSRVLAEALLAVQAQGLAVARVTASRSASAIPFGALAPLLPVDELLADSIVGVLKRAARAIAERGEGRPVVLAVDDAHLLDDASAMLVHQLAIEGTVRLLLTIRTGEQLSAALAGVVNDPSTATIEIVELRRPDVETITRAVLGGQIDGAVHQALWEGSQGNPLYQRELLVASIEDGAITEEHGVWRLVDRPTVPARLVELIESRLESVTGDARFALELLAVAPTIGRQALEDLVGTGVVSQLVQRGLVVVARDGRRLPVRLHHPLYEETLRRSMTSRRLRATQLHLADLIADTGMRRRPDGLQVTTLRIDAGGQIDLELLEAAALDAYFALDISLSERLARAGIAAGAGSRLRRTLAEVLRYQGRYEECEAILATISLADVDERERTLTAVVRAENLFRGLGEAAGAIRILADVQQSARDQVWRDHAAAMTATVTALTGDVRTALATALPIIERGPSMAMAFAATGAVAALTMSGRPDDAASIAEQAFAVASSLGPQEAQAVVAVHVMERCLGLLEAGRLEDAEAMAQLCYDWSLAAGHQVGQAWFALLLGRSAQLCGRLEESARRYREASLAFRDLRDHGIRRWALAGLAQVTAMLGRPTDATVALDELDTAPPTAVRLLEAEVVRARAWLALARGAQTEARRLLVEAADWAASRGQHGLELTMLHDLVRLGDTKIAAGRGAELAAGLQGPLAAARGLHAAGVHGNDAEQLDAATEAFADIGANLFAAEAAAHAAHAHRRAGRPAAAADAMARSAELAARCDAVVSPALSSSADRAAERLTPRELELATLAGRGMTSRDIAAQLGISVRTVNNQLQRAYAKLGVSGRHQLAERLGPAIDGS